MSIRITWGAKKTKQNKTQKEKKILMSGLHSTSITPESLEVGADFHIFSGFQGDSNVCAENPLPDTSSKFTNRNAFDQSLLSKT